MAFLFKINLMKQLEESFIGKGQVKGFIFTQLKKSEYAYIYEVNTEFSIHYEVFKHKENTQYNCISYPSNQGFGLWAWSFTSIERAFEKFDDINDSADAFL
jgi:hypothetical protein